MAHLCIIGRLQRYNETGVMIPNWPDMEFALYAQDDAWIFVGGRLKTVEEAKKLRLTMGFAATNSARDITISRLKIDVNKLREFRGVLTFGEGVYLPHDKFDKKQHTLCTATTEAITTRLVDSMGSPHL